MPAIATPIFRPSVKLAADTDANLFVTATGAAPAAGSNALGPTYNKGKANERVAVTALGYAVAVASAAVATGAALKVAANGKVLAQTGSTVTVARAITAAAAADDEITVMLIPN